MLTATHIETALKAAGAGGGLIMPADRIAAAFNDAILTYGRGQFVTANQVAALVSECMMESAYFRTTEEYAKNGRYAPYIGRTFIQITWQANYAAFGKWCQTQGLITDPDLFVKTPAELSALKWAALGGVWYFTQVMFSGKPLTAYSDDIGQVGKAVNLGNPFSTAVPNGQRAREAAYVAVRALGDSIVPKPPTTPPKDPIMYSSQWKTNYVSWRGGNFPPQTVVKLQAIPSYVRVTQGGLSGAPASAQTHKGLGAFDLSTDGMSLDQVRKLCRELWEVNMIPCMRGFSADSFQGQTISNTNDGNEHLHVLDLDEVDHMHPEAQAQVREILAGGDGLVGNRPFVTHGRSERSSWAKSPHNPANKRKPAPPKVTTNATKPAGKPFFFALSQFKGAVKVAAFNLRFPSHVAAVQTAINDLGWAKLTVDGKNGPVTSKAVSDAIRRLGGHKSASGYILTLPRLQLIIEAAEKKKAGDQYPPAAQG